MRIGLAYDLKQDVAPERGQPEDALEEYDSLETIDGLSAALQKLGHEIIRLGGGRRFLANILETRVEFVFNIAEGRGASRSREAQVPAVLEMLGIPYSGSDPECLAICLDKPLTKQLVRTAGVPTPDWRVISSREEISRLDCTALLPAFIKPAYEGSSKGVRLASRADNPAQIVALAARLVTEYRQPVMIERFIAGDEVTAGIIGNPPRVLGIMRVVPRKADPNFVYSLEVKRDWERLVDYECPARLPAPVLEKIETASVNAFTTLGCRDFGRVDFRVTPDGEPYFLEINPLAGLNPRSSDLPIMAGKLGWSYEQLIAGILDAARERYRL